MTNFEKIRTILDAGHLVMCTDLDEMFAVVRFGRDDTVWMSEWEDSIPEALDSFDGEAWTRTEIDGLDLKIDFIRIRPTYNYKLGEEIILIDRGRKANETLTIEGITAPVVGFNSYTITVDDVAYELDHRHICPARVFEEEAKETIMIGGKMYEVSDELKIALAKLKEVEV